MKKVQSSEQSGRTPVARPLSLAEIASLPWPTDEQLEAFVDHVCDAHSWYKHLPLRTGGSFDFFLAKDAGDGYTNESPRLHYGWKTTEEYRRRFGFLDYSGPWGRDGGTTLTVPSEVINATRVVLFPFVCKDLNAAEACLWSVHAEDIEQLLAEGAKSSQESDALRWYHSQRQQQSAWEKLSDKEADQVLAAQNADSDFAPGTLPLQVVQYLRVEQEATAVFSDLQAKEEPKVRSALLKLRELYGRLKDSA